MAAAVSAMLGGRQVLRTSPRSALDWVALVRRGLSARAFDALAAALHLSRSELAAVTAIPERTLARRIREGTLTSEESVKVLRVARVAARAAEVFENLDAAIHWMKAPNAALEGATPLSLLDTDVGAESVMDTLGRIEHGVYA
jgi:putative toxin-antitoxin system antitoxin component (TIGR02293 family)